MIVPSAVVAATVANAGSRIVITAPILHKPGSGLVLWRTPKHPDVVIASDRS